MIYGTLPGISKPVSRLVQGTVMVSSERWEESAKLLDGIFELGCTCFDTAHIYGGGDNERTVGRWIRERGIRESVVILGKGAHPYDGRSRVTPEDISSDIADSLERFGTDYIDLYLLHRDDESVPVGEIVEALNRHKDKGRIHAFGGSNWRHTRIEDANSYAKKRGIAPFAVSSPQFGLAWPQKPVWEGCITIGGPDAAEARDYYRRSQIPLFPWSSLGAGLFSGRFSRDNLNSFEDYFGRLCAECYGHEENFRRLERAKELGAKRGATAAQIAMAWLFSQRMNVHALVGCATAFEFAENERALEFKLCDERAGWLAGTSG